MKTLRVKDLKSALLEITEFGGIQDIVLDRIDGYLEYSSDIYELAYKIFEQENFDGSWYCNRALAEEEIFQNLELFASFYSEFDVNDFISNLNIFDNMETIHCYCLMRYGERETKNALRKHESGLDYIMSQTIIKVEWQDNDLVVECA